MKENDIFMQSLQGQLNQLNSAFSKFANESLDSGFVASILKATTATLNFMTAIGGLPTVLGAIATAFAVLNLQGLKNFGVMMLQGVQVLGAFISTLVSSKSAITAYSNAQTALTFATNGSAKATLALKTAMGGLIALGITAIIYGAKKAFDGLNVTVEEQTKKVEDLQTIYNDLQTKIDELSNKDNKTTAEEKYLDILKQQLDIQQQQLDIENQRLANKVVTGDGEMFSDGKSGELESSMKAINEQIKIYNHAMEMAESLKDKDPLQFEAHAKNATTAKERMMEFASEGITAYQEIMKYVDLLPEKEKASAMALLQSYDDLMKSLGEYGIGVQESKEATDDTADSASNYAEQLKAVKNATEELVEATDDIVDEINTLNSAIAKQTAGMSLSASEVDKLLKLYPQLQGHIETTTDGYRIETGVLEGLRDQSYNAFNQQLEGSAKTAKQIVTDCQAKIKAIIAEMKALQNLQEMYSNTDRTISNPAGVNRSLLFPEVNQALNETMEKAKTNFSETNELLSEAQSQLDSLGASSARAELAYSNLGNEIKSAGDKASKSKKDIKDYTDEIVKLGKTLNETIQDLQDFKKGFDQFKKGFVNDAFKEQKMSIKELEDGYASAKKELENLTEQYKKLKNNTKGDTAKEQLDKINDKIKEQQTLISQLTAQAKEYNEALKSTALEKLRNEQQGLNDTISQTIELIKYEQNLEKEKYQQLIDDAKEANSAQIDALKERVEAEKDAIDERLDALKESTDERKKLIKEEADAQKKALQDELKKYQEIINKRKELLDTQEEERDYQQQLAEKQQDLLNLQQQLQEAVSDDTLEGKTRRLKLEEEIAKKEKEIAELQHDWDINNQKKALDQMLEDKETQINDKIDAVEDGYDAEDKALDEKLETEEKKLKEQLKYWEQYLKDEETRLKQSLDSQVAQYQGYIDDINEYLSQEGTIRLDAMKRIETEGSALYDKLLEYNKKYGDGVDSTITKSWENAQSALEKYADAQNKVLTALGKMDALEEYTNSGGGVTVDKENDDKILADGGSDDEEAKEKDALKKKRLNMQKYYHDQMTKAINEKNDGLKKWVREQRKANQFDPDTGADLYKYHTGGIAGGDKEANLKSTEVFAKLMKGEPVVTESQAETFMKKTLPSLLGVSGKTINNNSQGDTYELTLHTNGGAVDPSTYNRLYNDMKKLIEANSKDKAMFQKGNRRSAKSLSI